MWLRERTAIVDVFAGSMSSPASLPLCRMFDSREARLVHLLCLRAGSRRLQVLCMILPVVQSLRLLSFFDRSCERSYASILRRYTWLLQVPEIGNAVSSNIVIFCIQQDYWTLNRSATPMMPLIETTSSLVIDQPLGLCILLVPLPSFTNMLLPRVQLSRRESFPKA